MVTTERIPTDDPVRQIWIRFGVLESLRGASRFLERRAAELAVEPEAGVLEAKAEGVAFTVRAAREYFEVPVEGNLNNVCLAYYYGALSLFEARLLADPRNALKLDDVEEFTKRGHGLKTFTEAGEPFPDREKVMVLTNGFFPRFLRAVGDDVDLRTIAVSRGWESVGEAPEEERDRIVSVRDLIARIPELRSLYAEVFADAPAYITFDRVGPDQATRYHFPRHKNWSGIDAAWIREMMGWDDSIGFEEDEQELRTEARPLAELEHGPTHGTVMADTACVRPILGINNVFLIEFVVLYVLSIWVRYRPALWREVSEGAESDFRAIVTNLLTVVARTLPNEILDRVYGRRFLFAGFPYYV
jgi:hypothetical protein